MKFKVAASDLRDALSMASLTVPKRKLGADSQLLFLQAVKGGESEHLVFFSTDSQASSRILVPCSITEPGKALIDPGPMSKNLSYTPDTAVVEMDLGKNEKLTAKFKSSKDGVELCQKRATYGARVETAQFEEDLAQLPLSEEPSFVINAGTFREILERTQPYLYKAEDKVMLQNVLVRTTLTGYEGLASDSVTLVEVNCPDGNAVEYDEAVLIPQQAIPALKKLLDKNRNLTLKVMVHRDEKVGARSMTIETDAIYYNTRLNADKFPDTSKILNGNPPVFSVKLPASDLRECLEEARVFAETDKEGDRFVFVVLREKSITVRAGDNNNEFERELAAETNLWPPKTESVALNFNLAKLANITSTLRDEDIVFGFTGKRTMATITGQTEDGKQTRFLIAGVIDKSVSVPKAA
jgi:DNA polymerase III sliding clamp (beta) subunit (PCNA family)